MQQISNTLAVFGVDLNNNGQLEESELNELGKVALARGFFVKDEFTGQKVITVALAEKAAKEVDGKFTIVAAGKEALRGLGDSFIKPFKDHPVRTTLIVGTVMGVTIAFPVVAPVAAAVATGVGIFKLTRGAIKMIKALIKKDGDAAESAFRDLAPGTLLTLLFGPVTFGKLANLAGLSGTSAGLGGAGASSAAAVCPGGT